MQYKIPVQIENEDVIVLGLSLRQIGIIMGFGGIGFVLFKQLEPSIGATPALFFAAPMVILGIVIGLWRVSEMTFLPFLLNRIRLSLNARDRLWDKGVDSFPEIEIGYITKSTDQRLPSAAPKDISGFLDTNTTLSKL